MFGFKPKNEELVGEKIVEQSVKERTLDVFKQIINIDDLENKSIRELYLCPNDMVQLICRLEEIFNIKVDDNHVKDFKTVKDVIAHMEKLVPTSVSS